MDIESISNIIRTKRKEKNLTQEELASRLKVTEKAISRWETGRGTPDISLLIPLSNELDISVSEILNGKEDDKVNNNIEEIINYIGVSKKKKSKLPLIITIILSIIILFLYLYYLKCEYSSLHIPYYNEFIINLFFIGSVIGLNSFISNYYFDKVEDKNKLKIIAHTISLVIYLIMLFNLTLLARPDFNETRYNLIPFKTIMHYFTTKMNINIFITNIFGNLFIFMPIEYYIIKVLKVKKLNTLIIINLILAIGIEVMQHITKTGILDIDDIILNLIGMFIVYLITKEKE